MAETITITDDRTGKTVTVPITDGVFPASAIRELDANLFVYDPAYMQTAACKSAITYLDGNAGILRYRGYPIEQLAEQSTYLEVAYLLLKGELPDKAQLEQWTSDVTHHTYIHENMRKRFVDGFHYDAHPMGMFVSAVAALGTFYNDSKEIFDEESREKQILRLIAKTPTIASMCHRFSVGLPFNYPSNSLSYPGNFLQMMWKIGDEYELDPVLERAMDVLFILHADHEQNCGTTAMRVVGSSHADPYSSAAAAASALYGPLHGGANEAVVRMLEEIGSVDNVPAFIDTVKRGADRLMGFGHRVYKNYDPRATIIKQTAYDVFEVTGKNPLLDIALKLEEAALSDPYFIDRKLYPNVDFYSGLIYQAMGFPIDMFTVLFAIPRTAGWLAHWQELLADKDQKISRPRQWYDGPRDPRLRHDRRSLRRALASALRAAPIDTAAPATIAVARAAAAPVSGSCDSHRPACRRGASMAARAPALRRRRSGRRRGSSPTAPAARRPRPRPHRRWWSAAPAARRPRPSIVVGGTGGTSTATSAPSNSPTARRCRRRCSSVGGGVGAGAGSSA